MTRLLSFVVATTLLSATAVAQVRGGVRGRARSGRAFGPSFSGHRRAKGQSGYFLGDTAFLYDDYPFGAATPELIGPATPELMTPPQFGVMPVPAAEAAAPKTRPLLIELEGDRYVRYGGAAESNECIVPAQEPGVRGPSESNAANFASADLPATVLVFRDGHREEVADYAIVGQVMYAHRAGEQGIGAGLNNIQIAELDVTATRSANRQKGVRFVLPAAPNQIVTRP